MSFVGSNILAGAAGSQGGAGYKIERSLRFNSADSAYLNRTPLSAGNRTKWTWSGWIKRNKLGTFQRIFAVSGGPANDDNWFAIALNTSNQITLGGYSTFFRTTVAQYRDCSAWMHLVVTIDLDATASMKIFVNGVQQTLSGSSDPSTTGINNNLTHYLGVEGASAYCDLQLAEVHFIDGQALAATDFGEFDDNNVWQPKEFTGTYNTAASGLGGHTWSNYIDVAAHSSYPLSNLFGGTIGSSYTNGTRAGSGTMTFDISSLNINVTNVRLSTYISGSPSVLAVNGSAVTGYSTGDDTSVVAVNGQLNTVAWSYDSSSGPYTYMRGIEVDLGDGNGYQLLADGANGSPAGVNGFRLDFSDTTTDQALGYDASVSSPALNNKGGFDAITYTGTGNTMTIKGLAFQPDLVWIKRYDGAAYHSLHDSVRGINSELSSNVADAESTAGKFNSFNSDGWTMKGGYGTINLSGQNFAAWAWKAGGTAASNTDGSITSQVSASNQYGFSVVTYTGTGSNATVGHGLNSAPEWIIVKDRDSSSGWWAVYHVSQGNTKGAYLNDTQAFSTQSFWNNTTPTNSLFSIGSNSNVNASGNNYVAYCWSEVSGFSKFSSYSGSGAQGNKQTLGFKPRWVMIKCTSTAGNEWTIFDTKRNPSNPADDYLYANSGNAQASYSNRKIEVLSDGFQFYGSDQAINTNGDTYIYAAFGDRNGNNWTPNNLVATVPGLETANQGMDVVTYTGNGSATNSISSLNFQPDLVWLKNIGSGGHHALYDSVRGVYKHISSNLTDADYTEPTGRGLSSFNANGFTIDTSNGDHVGQGNINVSANSYVAWCWKAGGAASSNTDGTITSSVSANNTYGFSVVKWSNPSSSGTVGHGLNAAPALILTKGLGSSEWQVYHKELGNAYKLYLNGGDAQVSSSVWSTTTPTSSVFNFDDNRTQDFIAYCWSEVSGFSKFGTYTGNGSATGPVIITGFKPRFVLVKGSSYSSNWNLIDIARSTSNPRSNVLRPNSSAAEFSSPTGTYGISLDVLDDGFQLKSGSSTNDINQTGATYIYAAFADKPPGEIIDSLIDTPTNYEAGSGNNGGNYATLNSLNAKAYNSSSLSDGNLKLSATAHNGFIDAQSTIAASLFDCYCEVDITAGGGAALQGIGVGDRIAQIATGVGSYVVYRSSGSIIQYPGNSTIGTVASYTTGDVIGMTATSTQVAFYKNGSLQGTYNHSLTDDFFVCGMSYHNGNTSHMHFNFGQRSFNYTIPTGFKSLCTTNLPDPTIADGSTAFDVALWSGTGSSQTISLGFDPDLIWSKTRNHAVDHKLVDSVRGFTKQVEPNQTIAEYTNSTGVTGTSSSGFTIGSSNDWNNSSSRTYVGWAWDAGSSTASNTDGSITSSVRANPSAGFSIVNWTAGGSYGMQSVGHGLNAKPAIVINKRTDAVGDWSVFTDVIDGSYDYLSLNSTSAASSATGYYQADSSTFDLSHGHYTDNGWQFIAYCFAPVEGYSAFGSYTGNGSTDGPFIYTGFKPAFLIIKNTQSGVSEYWLMMDSTRSPDNVVNEFLYPNGSGAEGTQYFETDFLSNGFKLRNSSRADNYNNDSYVYIAFAENPFKTARAR